MSEALSLDPVSFARQDARGLVEKKWLVLALHEAPAPGPKGSAVPGRAGVPKDPLGRVVLDLADFAAEDGRATRTLAVSFSTPAVKAAAGVPAKMLITIGCATGAPLAAVCAPESWSDPLLEERTGAGPGALVCEGWSGVLAGQLGMLALAGRGCTHRRWPGRGDARWRPALPPPSRVQGPT